MGPVGPMGIKWEKKIPHRQPGPLRESSCTSSLFVPARVVRPN